jgi:hypothetical protein
MKTLDFFYFHTSTKIGYQNNENKRLFWFDFALHAREWTTVSSALFLITNVCLYIESVIIYFNLL